MLHSLTKLLHRTSFTRQNGRPKFADLLLIACMGKIIIDLNVCSNLVKMPDEPYITATVPISLGRFQPPRRIKEPTVFKRMLAGWEPPHLSPLQRVPVGEIPNKGLDTKDPESFHSQYLDLKLAPTPIL